MQWRSKTNQSNQNERRTRAMEYPSRSCFIPFLSSFSIACSLFFVSLTSASDLVGVADERRLSSTPNPHDPLRNQHQTGTTPASVDRVCHRTKTYPIQPNPITRLNSHHLNHTQQLNAASPWPRAPSRPTAPRSARGSAPPTPCTCPGRRRRRPWRRWRG